MDRNQRPTRDFKLIVGCGAIWGCTYVISFTYWITHLLSDITCVSYVDKWYHGIRRENCSLIYVAPFDHLSTCETHGIISQYRGTFLAELILNYLVTPTKVNWSMAAICCVHFCMTTRKCYEVTKERMNSLESTFRIKTEILTQIRNNLTRSHIWLAEVTQELFTQNRGCHNPLIFDLSEITLVYKN